MVAMAGFSFLLSQDAIARLAWQRYGNVPVALTLVSRNAELAMQIGNYYFGRGGYDLERAERGYQKALRAQPGILWGHYQLARIHFVRGDYEKALEEISGELAANPQNLRSLYVRGLIYGYRSYPEDLAKAEEDFRRFTQWAPKEWAGYNDLAWILAKESKHKEAKQAIETAFRQVPEADRNPWLWNSLGVAELNLRAYSEAKRSFEKAKALAEKLSVRDWRSSYPGNDPASAEAGLAAFRAAIEENLKRAKIRIP